MKIKIFLLSLLILTSKIDAQNQNDIYAGLMFHFGKYVQWPANMQSGDFVIGVQGNSPLKGKLETLAASKNINGRKIVIKKVASSSDLEGCHILFVPDNSIASIAEYKSKIKANHVLLVTEGDGNLQKGSVFNFIEKDGKVRFEFSQSDADAHNLKVSSDLVKLAIVK
ncbi:MAG: YfiR family protein [Cytophagales bacterium]